MQFLISKSNLYHWKSFRRGVNQRKPTTTRKTRVMGLWEIWVQPDPYFSFKNDPYDNFFAVFCKISWFFGNSNLLWLPKSYHFVSLFDSKTVIWANQKTDHVTFYDATKLFSILLRTLEFLFFQIFLFLLAFDSKDVLRVTYIAVATWQ